MFSRRWSLLVVITLVSTLSFRSLVIANKAAAEAAHKVAFLPGAMSNPSQAFAAKMYQKYGPDYGFDVTILDGEGDAAIQAQTVTNAIAQGMDAIFINPNDINAIVPALMEASNAGVIVGMFSSDLPEHLSIQSAGPILPPGQSSPPRAVR